MLFDISKSMKGLYAEENGCSCRQVDRNRYLSLAHKSHYLITIRQVANWHSFLYFSGNAAKQITQVWIFSIRKTWVDIFWWLRVHSLYCFAWSFEQWFISSVLVNCSDNLQENSQRTWVLCWYFITTLFWELNWISALIFFHLTRMK